jgi:hypothetical protein
VVFGAVLIPWWNRKAFSRALVIPLVSLVALTLLLYFVDENLAASAGLLYMLSLRILYILVYGVLFVLFAVTCHRLVLLDPQSVATRLIPRWSGRETRFFLWTVAVWLIVALAFFTGAKLLINLWRPWEGKPSAIWSQGITLAASVPAYYVFGRLSLIFPATAVGRKVSLRWSWRLTANNGWRLFVVVAVLPFMISHLVGLLYRMDATALETVVLTFLGCALFVVEVAALSLSYRELTKEEAASAKPDPTGAP